MMVSGSPFGQYLSVVKNVGMIADAQCFPDIVVGDQYADIEIGQMLHDFLNFTDGDRVNTGEWFIQQDKPGPCRQCAGDFGPAPFSAGQTDAIWSARCAMPRSSINWYM